MTQHFKETEADSDFSKDQTPLSYISSKQNWSNSQPKKWTDPPSPAYTTHSTTTQSKVRKKSKCHKDINSDHSMSSEEDIGSGDDSHLIFDEVEDDNNNDE